MRQKMRSILPKNPLFKLAQLNQGILLIFPKWVELFLTIIIRTINTINSIGYSRIPCGGNLSLLF